VLKGIALAVAAFALFLPLHVVVLRALRPHFRFKVMTRLHGALAAAIVVAYWLTPPDLGLLPSGPGRGGAVLGILNALLVHGLLFMGYAMFYFLVDRGFSLRVMIEIEGVPGRGLGQDELAAIYPPAGVVRRRLGELVEIGRLTRDGERYRLTPRGRLDARLFRFVKAFLRFGPGG
jgi:hypothetical protein